MREARRLGDAVLVQGAPLLAEVLLLLRLGAHMHNRRDGMGTSPQIRRLLLLLEEALAEASMSSAGQMSRHSEAELSEWDHLSGDELTTAGAAELLGVGQRQAQRLASTVGAHRTAGGAFVWDRGAVTAYATQRKAANGRGAAER